MTRSMALLCRMGFAAPAAPRPTRVPRPRGGSRAARPVPPGGPPRPLRWLGLAQAPTRIGGHPRIRERLVAVHERRHRADRLLLLTVGIVIAVGLLAVAVVRSPLMSVETVVVRGLDDVQRALVLDQLAIPAGANVLDVDLRALSSEVESLPWVAAATVTRRLPSTVDIRVALRRPVATATYGDATFLLDGEGMVVEQTDGRTSPVSTGLVPQRLPAVQLAQAPVVGTVVAEPAVVSAVGVAAAMPGRIAEWVVAYRATAEGEVDATLRVPTDQGPVEMTVHLGRPDGIRDKAATVASLVEATVGRGVRPSVLDVRIPDRPVVRA